MSNLLLLTEKGTMETGDEKQNGGLLELRKEPDIFGPIWDAEEQLSFGYHSPGWRYYLCGDPVHAGDLLEMLCDDGKWECVRYEWNFQPQIKPSLFTNQDNGFLLPDGARFRWPQRK